MHKVPVVGEFIVDVQDVCITAYNLDNTLA